MVKDTIPTYLSVEDLNSGPHVCLESSLPTELSCLPLGAILYKCTCLDTVPTLREGRKTCCCSYERLQTNLDDAGPELSCLLKGCWLLDTHFPLLLLQYSSFSLSFPQNSVISLFLNQPVLPGHRDSFLCRLMWSSRTMSHCPRDLRHLTLNKRQGTRQELFLTRGLDMRIKSLNCYDACGKFNQNKKNQELSTSVCKQRARASL